MTQYVRSARRTLTSGLILPLVIACGHSARFEDALEKSKGQPVNGTGGTGTTGSGGMSGTSGSAGAAAMSGGGSGGGAPTDACSNAPSQQFDASSMKAYVPSAKLLSDVDDLVANMSTEERISQMLGVPVDVNNPDYYDIERSPDVTLAGGTLIRGYNYRDAGHGVNLDAGQSKSPHGGRASDGQDYSTVFPAVSARAASWDVDLEMRVGEALGDETAASMNNMLLAPCMNIIRHPFWGRTQETYGEDSYHIGRMATAFTVGLQKYVVACAKHFAANNVEQFRSKQDAIIDTEQTLREIYGRHFEMVIRDGGVGCIMASYNMINGVKSTQNPKLLTTILRGPVDQGGMGYRGLVLSDWWAMPGDQATPDPQVGIGDALVAAQAGLDIEVPWTLHYSTQNLTTLIDNGMLDRKVIENAAKHVIEQKLRFGTAYDTDPWSPVPPDSTLSGASIATNTVHEDLAEEVEVKSAVLLKNGGTTPVLPIVAANAPTIGVVGLNLPFVLISSTYPKSGYSFNFAETPPLGDRGSSRVNGDPKRCIGPTLGLQNTAPPGVAVTPYSGADVATTLAAVTANTPSFLVVVVGYTPGDEGEEYAIPAGGDRSTLTLPSDQESLVAGVLALNKPTVIVIESGSVVAMPWLSHTNQNQATVWAGYGGVRAGNALGKLLFGQANFSGKMPMAWPANDSQLDGFRNNAGDAATKMTYFFGYRRFDQLGMNPMLTFEYGRGLSYSTFTYSNLTVPCTGEADNNAIVNVTVDITNSAGPAGDEVAFLFIKPPTPPPGTTGFRPIKELKSFARVSLAAGAMTKAMLPLRIQDLRRWEGGADGKWVIDPGDYGIMVGPSGADADLAKLPMATLHVKGG